VRPVRSRIAICAVPSAARNAAAAAWSLGEPRIQIAQRLTRDGYAIGAVL
jgi:hypothetical protein